MPTSLKPRRTTAFAASGDSAADSITADSDVEREIDGSVLAPARFAALRHRNFRLFWSGNLVSLVGTLAQQTAQGWLVRMLTKDPFTMATVAACGWLPITLLTLYAGLVADRVDKRRALIITNAAGALLALALAALVWLGVTQVWHVALLSICSGIVLAFDIPVRQSFNLEMVDREDLPNAIAMNSTAFNGARVAGPAIGGFLIRVAGMAGCFLVNALSFLALIGSLLLMRLPPRATAHASLQRGDFWEGARFVRRHPTLHLVILLAGFISIFGMSFSTLMPIFAKDIFGADERGFSLLMTCNGLGALASALTLAAANTMQHKGKRLLLGAFLFCLSVVGFARAPSLPIACVLLVFAGWFLFTFLTTANTMVQTLSPDALRGRVFALYSLALIGTLPLGALILGALAKVVGTRLAVQCDAGLAAAFTLWVYLRFRGLWKEK